MILYDQTIDMSQPIQGTCSLSAVYYGDGEPVYVFTQNVRGWCPYRRVVSEVRTLKLKMHTSESMIRSHLVRNKTYIRAIYGHKPFIKAGEDTLEIAEKLIESQLITEYEFPIIDEFGMYVYMRLEVCAHNQDIDLRYTTDSQLENKYNYDLRDSIPRNRGEGHVSALHLPTVMESNIEPA